LLVFLSYHRASASWAARALKERLQSLGVDVFMDLENISSGRFDTVILNEIGRRDHFVALLTPRACERLATADSWVRKELERALELKKNVIPVFLDGASLDSIPADFPPRPQLVQLNALTLSVEFFAEGTDRLYERFLVNPTIEELEIRTAEEFFKAAEEARAGERWAEAERLYESAANYRRRPEYLLGLSVAKHRQGRDLEALNDVDAAIAADPFAFELMSAKFDLLQQVDRLHDAIHLRQQWQQHATQRAAGVARRILAALSAGADLATAARSIPELAFLYGHLPTLGRVGSSVEALLEHLSDDFHRHLQAALRQAWESWRAENEPRLGQEWELWKSADRA
jgi:tetratricopeptide (TPR) repeat protein